MLYLRAQSKTSEGVRTEKKKHDYMILLVYTFVYTIDDFDLSDCVAVWSIAHSST